MIQSASPAKPTSIDVSGRPSSKNMIWIPGATFLMGSDHHYPEEAPAHKVTVNGFWMDRYLVTNAQFQKFVKATGYVTLAERPANPADYPGAKPELLQPSSTVFVKPDRPVSKDNHYNWWSYVPGANWRHPEGKGSSIKGREQHPVVHLADEDVEAYAQWIGKELPTEAEWEFAARGGLEDSIFAWGDELNPKGKQMANTWQGEFPLKNLCTDGYDRTSPVGVFPKNGYGLYDMIGNVWERTADWYQEHGQIKKSPCCTTVNPRGGDRAGSRATGNDGGSFAVAVPNWKGETPAGIEKVIPCETQIASALFRTQLYDPSDLENVKQIQQQYSVKPLSAFLSQSPPDPAPTINFPKPLTPETQRTSIAFFDLLNFYLQFCPTHPSEVDLMERFARIGIRAGKDFTATLSPELKQAAENGMTDAWKEFDENKKANVDTGKITAADGFGTREFLQNNYLFRMTSAALGIYGNSKEEALYPAYYMDSEGQKLNGAHRYTVRFEPGQFPPANAFWSITMYELPASLLVANPIDRYLINSPMLPHLKRNDDQGITLYIQNESPGKDKESNWLPAPTGPFWVTVRLYWPKEEALNGTWKLPPMQRIKE